MKYNKFTLEQLVNNEWRYIDIVSQLLDDIQRSKVKIIALHGEMGVGKTTLIRQMIRYIAQEDIRVTSPTFSLSHIYTLAKPNIRVAHYDLYRVNKLEELEEIGIFDFSAYDIAFIEWPNIALPQFKKLLASVENNVIKELLIENISENERQITIL
jgi:tRNA threonylcarbamoyladenosine biosynthesis protein TsaE